MAQLQGLLPSLSPSVSLPCSPLCSGSTYLQADWVLLLSPQPAPRPREARTEGVACRETELRKAPIRGDRHHCHSTLGCESCASPATEAARRQENQIPVSHSKNGHSPRRGRQRNQKATGSGQVAEREQAEAWLRGAQASPRRRIGGRQRATADQRTGRERGCPQMPPRAMAQPADPPARDASVSTPQTVAAGQEPGAGTHPLRADL